MRLRPPKLSRNKKHINGVVPIVPKQSFIFFSGVSLIALEGNLFDPKNLDTVPGYEASSSVSVSSLYIAIHVVLCSSVITSFNRSCQAA
jgi:hypothetical protein